MSGSEAVKMVRLADQADKFIKVEGLDDLFDVLMVIWPRGRVTKNELFDVFTGVTGRTVILSNLGLKRRIYSVLELARFFWERSNYGMDGGG